MGFHGVHTLYVLVMCPTGGLCRVCLLGEESVLVSGMMRKSGDLGLIDSDGHLYYLGREDRQVKRWGTRLSLELIQQVGQLLPNYCSMTDRCSAVSIYGRP